MAERSPVRLFALTGALLVASSGADLHAQVPDIDFSQVTRPVVQVTDSAMIDYLLFELFVEPATLPSRLQVIDVTQNGFGPDDVMIAFPSVEVFTIPAFLPDSVQAIMSSWAPEVEYRMDSGNMSASALGSLIGSETDSTRLAEGALLYDLVQAVERSYRDLPVALLFQRDSVGFTFQLWDYNRPSMTYAPRPEFVPDTAIAAVLQMLRRVGYVPGQNATGTGLSLEATGQAVVTVDRALQGMTQLPSEQMRILAAQTVLLGSYDLDRSGAIDQADEIDAPTCAVWSALNEAFPDYLSRYGFGDTGDPYVGDVVFNISDNVRAPGQLRASACLAGRDPPPTDPAAVPEPETGNALPEAVERFVRLEAAGEILQEAGRLGTTPAQWAEAVRAIMQNRFDRDGSGLLDRTIEIRSVPCDVWQAMAATHPEYTYGMGFLAGDLYAGDHIGVSASLREELLARASGCVQASARTADAASGPVVPEGLSNFLDLLTAAEIARSTSGTEPGSVRWANAVKNGLVSQYDLDDSGEIDQTDEVIEIPCPVWQTIEATLGSPLTELGIGGSGDYFADQIGIAIEQRDLVAARVGACTSSTPG
ncbi:MAG: hypothetical protein ACPHQP_06960 [Longimicrobiales bacterium]